MGSIPARTASSSMKLDTANIVLVAATPRHWPTGAWEATLQYSIRRLGTNPDGKAYSSSSVPFGASSRPR